MLFCPYPMADRPRLSLFIQKYIQGHRSIAEGGKKGKVSVEPTLSPFCPAGPGGPTAPLSPFAPGKPSGPVSPGAPIGP